MLIDFVVFVEFSCLFRLRRNCVLTYTVQHPNSHCADRAQQRQRAGSKQFLQSGISGCHTAKCLSIHGRSQFGITIGNRTLNFRAVELTMATVITCHVHFYCDECMNMPSFGRVFIDAVEFANLGRVPGNEVRERVRALALVGRFCRSADHM